MQIIIDSKPVEIDTSGADSFEKYCSKIMAFLVEKDRSISSCKIDGTIIKSVDQANELFKQESSLEVETITVAEALAQAVHHEVTELETTIDDCEELVTDCLLEEPQTLADNWESLCEKLKVHIGFIPNLGPLLSEDQINHLIDHKFGEIESIMKDAHKVLNKADVVSFSDILELRLSPWIQSLREFMETQQKMVNSILQK